MLLADEVYFKHSIDTKSQSVALTIHRLLDKLIEPASQTTVRSCKNDEERADFRPVEGMSPNPRSQTNRFGSSRSRN